MRQASDAAAREQLERVVEVLVTERCKTLEDCIEWARQKFQARSAAEGGCPACRRPGAWLKQHGAACWPGVSTALAPVSARGRCRHRDGASRGADALRGAQMHFHDRIAQLVYTFPEDAPTSTGALFWSAPKRFPRALDWSAADPSHAAFVQAAALLRAEVYGITAPAWAQDPAKVTPPAAGLGLMVQGWHGPASRLGAGPRQGHPACGRVRAHGSGLAWSGIPPGRRTPPRSPRLRQG